MMETQHNKDSQNIMGAIKPGTVGAEIGVWYGNTSMQFVKQGVKELHLVDPWSVEPYKESDADEHGGFEKYLDRYQKICGGRSVEAFTKYYDKVAREVEQKFFMHPQVKIHRMTSTEWFNQFEGELDWIYIDGDHSYEGCLRDLRDALKVVKKGGTIFGDDFRHPGKAGGGKPGVVKAVKQFLEETSFESNLYGTQQIGIRVA